MFNHDSTSRFIALFLSVIRYLTQGIYTTVITVLATLLLLLCFGLQPSIAADGTLDTSFAPDLRTNGEINILSIQTDGKILIGGNFTYVNNTARNRIARLNTDGTLDTSFDPGTGANDNVNTLNLQSDGKILIGGDFTRINGTSRRYIARLNANGGLDTTFDIGTGAYGVVSSLAIQSDGKVLIGGYFTSYNGTSRNRIARINTDGSLDTSFDPGTGANHGVLSIAVQSDGKVLIGGYFTSVAGSARNYIARLNTNGSLDTGFNSNIDSTVNVLTIQNDDKMLIGGTFTNIGGTARNNIALLNTDGSLDTTFDPGTGTSSTGGVDSITVQTDSKVLIGGTFTQFNGTTRNSIARLNSDGSLDSSFDPDMEAYSRIYWGVRSFAVQTDNQVLIGGGFTSVNGTSRDGIARLDSNGNLDTGFNPSLEKNGVVHSLAQQTDSKILIGGDFRSINGTSRNNIARLSTDGSLDTSFDPGTGTNDMVYSLIVQPDGRILIGGRFNSINGTNREGVARLNTNGNLDTTFVPTGTSSTVMSLALQPDSKVLVGGSWWDGTSYHVARLNIDGGLDSGFIRGVANNWVNSVAIQSDGKVLIGGNFTTINGTTRNRIARLNTDGSVDTSLDPGTGMDNDVESLVLQSDGKMVVGGRFTSINGTNRNRIARLNANGTLDTTFNPGSGVNWTTEVTAMQSDGKVLIGGEFWSVNDIVRYNIARLNSDGSLDTGFDPGTGTNGRVYSITQQNDNNILIGGDFTTFNGTVRNGIARLLNTPIPTVNLSVSTNTGTETDTTAITVTATASEAVTGNQTVDLGVSGSGITVGDYTLSGTQITILDSTTSGNVTFTVQDDADSEGTEIATLTLSNPSAGIVLGTPVTQNVTLIDNDMPDPAIAISGPTIMAGNVLAGTSHHVLYRLNLAITTANAMLTGITVTTGGTYQTSDIETDSFKLRYSTDATLDVGDAVLKNLAVVAPGNNLVFDNLSQNIAKDTTGYLFITADIATTAISGRTIDINAIPLNNISFAVGVKSGDDPQSAGGLQTIVEPPDPWPMYRYDLHRSGQSPYQGIQQPEIKWQTDFSSSWGSGVDNSITVDKNGNLYLGTSNNKLYAIDKHGQVLWVYDAGKSIGTTPTIDGNGTLYFGTEDIFYALNPDGSEKWTFSTYYPQSAVIAQDGTIYFGSDYVYALNPDGTKKWVSNQYGFDEGVVLSHDGTLYYGYSDKLRALDSAGNLKWETVLEAGSYLSGGLALSNDEQTIYIGTWSWSETDPSGKFYAVNVDGNIKWEYVANAKSAPAVGSDGTIYFGSKDKHLYALAQDGTLKWRFYSGYEIDSPPTLASDNSIYFSSFSDKFFALNADGTERWQLNIARKSPIIPADGELYLIGNGAIYAVVDATQQQATVQFTTISNSVTENVGTVTVIAELSISLAQDVTIPFIINGTADSPEDYSITASPIIISAGSTTGTATITIVDDNLGETNENIIITMGTTNNAVASGNTDHTLTITDNELPVAQADFSISQTESTDPVFTGTALSYTLNVNNAGPDPATDVQVTDTLPSGVVFGSATGTDWTCNEATGTVTCTLASLNVGAANPITINVTAPGTAGNITNTATISATTADSETSNNNTSETTTVNLLPQADLSITQTESSDPVFTGSALSYTLNINNAGPDPATDVQVTDTLPGGVVFGSATGTDWTCNEAGGIVTCTLASLNMGAANPITINVTAPVTIGSLTNTATVGATTADSDTINNNATETTTISDTPASEADLSITQTDSSDPVFTTMALAYTLNVNNAGPGTANNIEVTDTLPGNVTFMSASGTDWMCNELSGTVTCTLASLNVGAANPIMIHLMAPSTIGSITNNATVNATTTDPDTSNNNVSESTQVDNLPPPAQADLSITKTGSVDSVLIGTRFSYVLNVNNAGPDTATDISVSDNLQNGQILSSASGDGWTCYETGGYLNCSLASLSTGAANPITVNVIAPGTVSVLSKTAGVSTSANDPDSSNNNISESIQVHSSPPASLADLSVTQTESADPVLAGTSFNYTLNVNNAGPATATNVEVVDRLPNDLTFNSVNAVGWTCNESNGTVICTQPSLSVGVANPITINVTGQMTAMNHVSISSSTTPDPQTNNNRAFETTTINITPTADLGITLTDSSEPVLMNSNFSYTLNINNAGPDTATDVKVSNMLPAGVTFVSANGTDWNCSGSSSVTCTLASLNVGTANPITINVTAPSTATSLDNMASISSSTISDPNTTNNYASERTTVNTTAPFQADLSISQTHTPDPVVLGDYLTYTLNVNNAGPDTATDIEVTNTLPNGVSLSTYDGMGWMCNGLTNTVTCTLSSLSVGAANPININVSAPNTLGNITNQATVKSLIGVDSDTSNNSVSETVMITALPQTDLSISQTESADPVSTSAAFSYTLNINNAGPVPADVEVIDILPTGVIFGSATGTDWTCSEVTGTVTCTLASLNMGAANPITINVTAPSTAGTITNHVSARSIVIGDPDMSNNNVSENTTITSASPQADLSITQTESSDPVFTGSALSYTLNINNAGPDPATDVQVTDTLPGGVVFGSATGTDWTCNEATGTVTCTLASLNMGAANPITINVTAPGTAGNITNTATINATTADSDTSNNNTSETTTVNLLAQADLSITQTDSSDPVFTGTALSYTLTVNNAGPDPASDVTVTDILPSGVLFGSATGTDWTCNEAGGIVTCTLANLNTGAANPITINVTAPGTAGNITNTATISATTADSDTSNNNTSETTTVNVLPQADLLITQTESSDPVFTGTALSYSLTVNNAGPDPATDVQVTDTLPSGVVFGTAIGTDWTCNEATGTVTCTLANLNTGAANPITISLAAPGTAGNITNTATISATTADSDTSNNNTSETTTVNVLPQADLSITQTESSDPVFTGAALSYTLTVNNAGPDPATDVQVTDTLPSGVVFGTAIGTDWTCNEATGTVTCTLANLNTGAANPITISLAAPGTAGNITNTATISATTADSDTSNNNVSESTTVNVLPQADLSITQTDSSDPVFTGAALSYTLNVNNAGPDSATDVQVTDTLPSGVVFGSASGTDWTCNEVTGTVTCTLSNLNMGAANPITINVTAPGSAGNLTNTATISATTADSDTSNNNTSESTTVNVLPQADLSITQTDSSDPVFTGAALSYTLNVNNAGPDSATDVQVTNTLPNNVVFSSASGTDWTCNEVTGTVTCTLASLNTGAANPITINLIAPGTAGSLTNTATITATTADPDTTNNNVSESTTVNTATSQADLSLTQTDSSDPISTGNPFSYTLTVNNAGPATANDVQVINTLPSNVSFGSASGTDWTCNQTAGTVTCTLASLNTGAANPITINLTAPGTAGSLTNTATVSATTADSDTSNNHVSESTTVNVPVPPPPPPPEPEPVEPVTTPPPSTSSSVADLLITQTDASDPVKTGESFSYVLTISNAGPNTATDLEVIDTLPTGLDFVSVQGNGWQCQASNHQISCQLDHLRVHTSSAITLNVTAPSTAGQFTNTATVYAMTGDPNTGNNSIRETTTVKAPILADVSITQTASSDPVNTGHQLSYTLNVKNAGPNTANTIKVIDSLPKGVIFESANGKGWTCQESGSQVSCTLASLNVGAANPITVNMTAPNTAGTITNTATVSAETADPDTDNNNTREDTSISVATTESVTDNTKPTVDLPLPPKTDANDPTTVPTPTGDPNPTVDLPSPLPPKTDAHDPTPTPTGDPNTPPTTNESETDDSSTTEKTTVETLPPKPDAQADLSITKTNASNLVFTTDSLSYNLTVNNNGPDTATNIVITETLPEGVIFVSASGNEWTCQESDRKLTCTLATLEVNEVNPLTLNLAGENIAYGIDTTTTVDAETTDPETQDNLSENSTISTVVVDMPIPKADLSLTQTDSRDPILSNSRFSYTLTIQNAGPNLAQHVMVIDTLPNGVIFDSVNETDWQCHDSQGQIICTLDNLARGAAKAITLNVIAPNTASSLTNQATVSAITLDPAKDNNSISETTQVAAPQADLSITQTASDDPVLTKRIFSYTLTVKNAGPETAQEVTVTDNLPNDVNFISARGTDWTCDESEGSVTCTQSRLEIGQANPITLKVSAPKLAGKLINTATISATTGDPEEENNSVSETTVVKAPPLSPAEQSLTLEVGDTITVFNIEGGNGPRTLTEKPDTEFVNFSYSDNDRLILTGLNQGTTRLVISDSGQPPSTATLNITVHKLTCGNAQGIDQAGNLINQTGACFTGTISVTSDKTCDNEAECSHSGNHLTVVQSDEIGITAHVDVAPEHIGSSAELLILAIQKHSGTQLSYYRDAQGDWHPLEQGHLSQIQAFEQYDTLPESLEITLLPKGYVTNLISGEFIIYTGYRLEDGSVIFNGQEPLHFIVANSLAVDKAGNPLPDPSAYFSNEISIDSESEGEPVKLWAND